MSWWKWSITLYIVFIHIFISVIVSVCINEIRIISWMVLWVLGVNWCTQSWNPRKRHSDVQTGAAYHINQMINNTSSGLPKVRHHFKDFPTVTEWIRVDHQTMDIYRFCRSPPEHLYQSTGSVWCVNNDLCCVYFRCEMLKQRGDAPGSGTVDNSTADILRDVGPAISNCRHFFIKHRDDAAVSDTVHNISWYPERYDIYIKSCIENDTERAYTHTTTYMSTDTIWE